jgi:hypothetical protein
LLSRLKINRRQIWAFFQIAPATSPTKVCRVIGASMLPGYDVLDVKRQVQRIIRKVTVFAPVGCALLDQSSVAASMLHFVG